jgi:tetracycline 7-halogenase / FADH2 O2-dependent halogenase
MTDRCEVAIVGSGFAGSLLARILARIGYDVVLIERGAHPRFSIGESTTPLANLGLERLARRYGMADCHRLAAHGRWLEHHPDLRRGLKRGFTFYRHHPGQPFHDRGLASERLLVAASPSDAVADTHWLRADVDHHFVKQAVAGGVDYRDRTNVTRAEITSTGVRLGGRRDDGSRLDLHAEFVVDASGPGGFVARQLAIPSGLRHMRTRSAMLCGHFTDVRPLRELAAGLPDGPYPDHLAAVHHLIDEGWMYSLRFDHGVTSAGFMLTPRAAASATAGDPSSTRALWCALLERYPTLGAAFADARPVAPLVFRARIQHRRTHAVGERWAMLPHAFAFVDPLFSTGIAWSIRAVERLARAFEERVGGARRPADADLRRYGALLGAEAGQIDVTVAGAYEAMAHFDLFAAHAMLYFATVSFAEASERLVPDDSIAWRGFLGVGDSVLEPLPRSSFRRLRRITRGSASAGTPELRRSYVDWAFEAMAPRNIAGLGDSTRHNLYPADLDVLVERHALLGLSRAQVVDALPALRGMEPEPTFVLPAATPAPPSRAGVAVP